MKIGDIFKEKSCVFSIECFPPKKSTSYSSMQETLNKIASINPDFVSVTYGAGGSSGGVSTMDIASYLKNELKVEPLAHVVCMGATRESIRTAITELSQSGVQNVLALRGDATPLRPKSEDFAHASDLMFYIRFLDKEIGLSGACYPEGHPESESPAFDLETLKIKQAAGADHLITQLFFDNTKYYRFLNRVRKAGIMLPVSAGIMPIVKSSQIARTVALSSASLPSEFTRMVSRYQDNSEAMFDAGIDYAITQIRDLIEGGADGIHLYAMNNFEVARRIYEGIADLL